MFVYLKIHYMKMGIGLLLFIVIATSFSMANSNVVRSWCDENGCHTVLPGGGYSSAGPQGSVSVNDNGKGAAAFGGNAFNFGYDHPKPPKPPTPPKPPKCGSPNKGNPESSSWSTTNNDKGATSFSSSSSKNGQAPKTFTYTTGNGKATAYADNDDSTSYSKSASKGNDKPKTDARATGHGVASSTAVNNQGVVSHSEDGPGSRHSRSAPSSGAQASSSSSGNGQASSWSSSTGDKGTSVSCSKSGDGKPPKTYTHTTGDGVATAKARDDKSTSCSKCRSAPKSRRPSHPYDWFSRNFY